jgi:hypothetical protein
MRTWVRWLAVLSVVGTFGTGCASGDNPGEDSKRSEHHTGNPVSNDCSRRIDEQITSGEIPNADRDYFVGMCEANH